jgi:hypothetical protein
MTCRALEKYSNDSVVIQTLNSIFLEDACKFESDLKLIYNELLDLPQVSDILYDSEVFEFSAQFDKLYFRNLSRMVSTYQNLGSYESVISVIKGIFGGQANILFENDGKTWKLSNLGVSVGFITIFNGIDFVVQTDGTSLMEVVSNVRELGLTDIIRLLHYFMPAGIKYTIIFLEGA